MTAQPMNFLTRISVLLPGTAPIVGQRDLVGVEAC